MVNQAEGPSCGQPVRSDSRQADSHPAVQAARQVQARGQAGQEGPAQGQSRGQGCRQGELLNNTILWCIMIL